MAKKSSTTVTPLMKQYNAIKAKHPGALLLFRVGDFYETFGQDAPFTFAAFLVAAGGAHDHGPVGPGGIFIEALGGLGQ